MRHAGILFTLLCALCACSLDEGIDTTFDPCSPLTVVPGPDTEAHETQSLQDAIEAWSRVLPTRVEVGTWSEDDDALSIVFESGDTFYRATYWDQRGEIAISRDKLERDELTLAIAHELGHAFGLFHVSPDVRASVMNVGNLEVSPSPEDGLAVSALWDSCTDASGTDASVRPE